MSEQHPQSGQIRPRLVVSMTAAAAAVLILGGVLAAVLHGHHSTPTVHAAAAQPDRLPATTTTAPTTTQPPTTTAAPTTSTSTAPPTTTARATPIPTPAAPVDPRPTTTTTAAPSCVMSHNPACGPMYFSPAPGPDQPLQITVTTTPANPTVGQPVTFHVVMNDPDGPIGCVASENDGIAGTSTSCDDYPTCDRFGAWPPPAPAPAHKAVDYTETYPKAGQYTFSIQVDAQGGPCTDARTGRGEQPYSSSGAASTTFTVSGG